MRNMQAVVSPQYVINDCMVAADMTGLGRNPLMRSLKATIDHFAFCPLDYTEVSQGLEDMLNQPRSVELPLGGKATMGLQKQQDPVDRMLCWYWGNPLPALAVVDPQNVPLQSGGGYVAVRAELELATDWLRSRSVGFEITQLYGVDTLWVPLMTPGWGIGCDYFGLCVTAETLLETTQRLAVTK